MSGVETIEQTVEHPAIDDDFGDLDSLSKKGEGDHSAHGVDDNMENFQLSAVGKTLEQGDSNKDTATSLGSNRSEGIEDETISGLENKRISPNEGDADKQIGDVSSKEISSYEEREQSEKEDSEKSDGWVDVLGSGDILKKTIIASDKDRPSRGDTVTIKYRGSLESGIIVDDVESEIFILGDGDVIHAFDLAVSLMNVEETAELKVGARFAYGSKGRIPDIPPKANLCYEVSLLTAETAKDDAELTVSERIHIGNKKRERGNYLYSREDYSDAVNSYNKGVKYLDDSRYSHKEEPPELLQELVDLRVKCYNNLAAAQLKIEAYDAAIKSCDEVLAVQPENVKALFRKGKVLGLKGETESGISVLRKALKIDPEVKIIHQELSRLVSKKKKEDDAAKRMYRRMFEPTSSSGSSNSSSFKWAGVAMAVGAITAAVVSVVTYKYFHLS